MNVQEYTSSDREDLLPLLFKWVVDPETGEVDKHRIVHIISLAEAENKEKGDRFYLVARDGDEEIVGFIGYKDPCNYMQSFCKTNEAAEIINFYTADNFLSPEIANLILAGVEERVKKEGIKEMVLNRPPVFAKEQEEYLNSRKDLEKVGVVEDFFGPGFSSPVWVKKL